ncbi:MAG TPA: hypothetical protein DCG69_09015 [Bacteroidales bacterium]|nr:hypothetical protein [Bacteroidales bacterium]
MNKTILVPTDFSQVCENAMRHAAGIAKYIQANILLVHVINSDTKKYLKRSRLPKASIEEYLQDYKNQLIDEYGIQVDFRVLEGKLLEQLSILVRSIKVDLLMFGTHGKTGIQMITGSHAIKLINAVKIPVLVVQKRGFENGYKTIVFPVNTSTEYKVKLDWTIFIAKSFGSTIKLFVYNETRPKVRAKMETVLVNIRASFLANNIKFTEEEAEYKDNFPKQIRSFAAASNADLIAIKVDNDEFEPSFILGSPEEKMLFNSAQIPVFCAQRTKP